MWYIHPYNTRLMGHLRHINHASERFSFSHRRSQIPRPITEEEPSRRRWIQREHEDKKNAKREATAQNTLDDDKI